MSMFHSVPHRAAKLATLSPSASSSSSASCCSLVEADLRRLRGRMERIRALFKDSEEQEIREASVRVWLAGLRDVAYDSEDVLQEVEYALLRHQLECDRGEDERGVDGQLDRVSDTPARRPPPLHDAAFQKEIVAKIKEVNDLFEEICSVGRASGLPEPVVLQSQDLKLHAEDWQRCSASGLPEPPLRMPTGCFVDELGVHGRDDDKSKVIDMLLSDDLDDGDDEEHVRVVSIVGIGGLGKTTLAQLVYNNDQVANHFEKTLWVCVSDNFDVARLTKEILEALEDRSTGVPQEFISNFSVLQQILHRKLQGKRFLLVLDDVWNESHRHWEALWAGLSIGAEGSRVLITTRSEKVSRVSRVNPAYMHRLGCLSEGDCWSLFEQRAFGGRSSGDYPELVQIGRKIVRRCKGIPLTVKTLAGLLFHEFGEDRWMDVLKSELWELQDTSGDIFPALKLSYRHLPPPLKPCFAYCAAFPKDHEFDRDKLVWMWMAHGFIKPSATRCMEDVGRGYFEDLLQRSFFQECKTYFPERRHFVMHDLIHDLASSIWNGECCQAVDGSLSSDKARHLVFSCWKDIGTLLSHEVIPNPKRWRTSLLISIQQTWQSDGAPLLRVLDVMFVTMKYLRVLYLDVAYQGLLPDSVGQMKHLRYLCISGCDLTGLPESLGELIKLQSLKISRELCCHELPKRLKDLVNLRHLDFSSKQLSMMPCGIGRLTQLRTLPSFVVGEGIGAAGIEELTGLDDLQGELKIVVRSLNNWVKWSGGMRDNYREEVSILGNKQVLESLVLQFGKAVDFSSYNKSAGWATMQQRQYEQESLLESLQPHTNIKKIRISGYGGGNFPKWMGLPSYRRLERINLENCVNCIQLAKLGQLPSLKHLGVWSKGTVMSMGSHFLGPVAFPSLEKLVLKGVWPCDGLLSIGTEGRGDFPCLSCLEICQCSNLICVKLRHLSALRELNIRDCEVLSELDYYNDDVSNSPSRSSLLPPSELHEQEVRTNYHMHIPSIGIMILQHCPKLNFPSAEQHQQQLPPSLWRLDISRSPLLDKWARTHCVELVHLTCLRMDDGLRQLLSLLNVEDVDEPHAWEYIPFTSGAQELELLWDDVEQQGFPFSPAEAEQLLNKLHPPNNLEELVVQGYRGQSFPEWVGDPSRLYNLVKMTLSGCIHCNCLPPLGQLPSLEHLHISRMPKVRHVGCEFAGRGTGDRGAAFQLLQTLEFYDMPQWEAWREVKDNAFPNLQVLKIYNCPNLTTFKLTVQQQLKLESDTVQYMGAGHFSRMLLDHSTL